jgi:hypothetical protein
VVSRHTPGPWRPSGPLVKSQHGDVLAECWEECQEANARLIAAAPDLIDIAQAIYQPFLEGTLYSDHDYAAELLGRLRKAIAKAEGRER